VASPVTGVIGVTTNLEEGERRRGVGVKKWKTGAKTNHMSWPTPKEAASGSFWEVGYPRVVELHFKPLFPLTALVNKPRVERTPQLEKRNV